MAQGKFPVEVVFWEDLSLDLSGERRLLAKHFPDWTKLTLDHDEPQLDVSWLLEDGTTTRRIAAAQLPRRLTTFLAHFRQFDADELEYLKEHSPEDFERVEQYLADVSRCQRDEAAVAAWLDHKAPDRFKLAQKIGLAVSAEVVAAREILVTVSFPKEIEVYEVGGEPKHVDMPTLPRRPRLKAEELPQSLLLDPSKFFPSIAAVARMPAVTIPRLTIPNRTWSVDIERHELELRIAKLPPRRQFPLEHKDGILLAALAPPGIYKARWTADAENLTGPAQGELEVEVRPSTDADWDPDRGYIGPPIEVTRL